MMLLDRGQKWQDSDWVWLVMLRSHPGQLCRHTHTNIYAHTHSHQCLCFDRGFRLCPINLVVGLLKTCTSNQCNHHCVWTLSLCLTVWLGWVCLNESERKRAGDWIRALSLCVPVVACVCLPALLLLSRFLRDLYFNWEEKNSGLKQALNPKFASFPTTSSPVLLPSLNFMFSSLFFPPFCPLAVCRGSHGNVNPIQFDQNGGREYGAVVYDLWCPISWAVLGYDTCRLLWG